MQTFRPVSVDYWRFNRSLISNDFDSPLEYRGPLRLLKVFSSYKFTSKQIKFIKLTTAARSKGCQDGHNRVLLQLEEFLKSGKHTPKCDLLTLCEDSILDYVMFLENNSAKIARLSGLKGAVQFLCACCRLPDLWTLSVDRAFEAAYRRAAAEKPPTKKAAILDLWVLPTAIETFISPFSDNYDKIPIPDYRALMFQLLQVHLCARGGDLRKLRACDFAVTTLGLTRVPVIAVTFRTAKNDVRYEGRTSYLVFSGSVHCPYTLLVQYFNRLRIYSADTGVIDRSYVFCRTGNGAAPNQSRLRELGWFYFDTTSTSAGNSEVTEESVSLSRIENYIDDYVCWFKPPGVKSHIGYFPLTFFFFGQAFFAKYDILTKR